MLYQLTPNALVSLDNANIYDELEINSSTVALQSDCIVWLFLENGGTIGSRHMLFVTVRLTECFNCFP